jgi:hypothetical protein
VWTSPTTCRLSRHTPSRRRCTRRTPGKQSEAPVPTPQGAAEAACNWKKSKHGLKLPNTAHLFIGVLPAVNTQITFPR